MQEIKIKGLDETIYHEILDNGLNIYLWNNSTSKSFKGILTVFMGADDTEFSILNKKYQVHRGSAHYLEHMVCENVNEKSYLEQFNELGSYSNAYTSSNYTTYEFVGTKKLKENILTLLKNVFEKEFSTDIIEREKNPILEEMRMRLDNPTIIKNFTLNEMLYKTYPNKIDLIGTSKDIQAINKKEIEMLYHSFYHPSNMALIITGNFDVYEIITTIKQYFLKHTFSSYTKPQIKKYRENKSVNNKNLIKKANVEIPELTLATKIPLKNFAKYDLYTILNSLQLLLATNFGNTSLLKEELLTKKLIYNLYFYVYKCYDYIIIEITCRSKYPKEVEEILKNKLQSLTIDKKDIERKIASVIASLILSYEHPEDVGDMINYYLINHQKIYANEKELLEKINIKDIEKIYNLIDFSQMVSLTLTNK